MSNNKYMDYFENFKGLIKEYYQDRKNKFLNETSSGSAPVNESFSNENKSKNKIEPFKEEVTKLKELYENIKTEIQKLK
jgi:archaellum component FlaC